MKRYLMLFVAVMFATVAASSMQGCKSAFSDPETHSIILMIGDGMGAAHVTALMLAENGNPIALERATAGGMVKTHSANNRVTDSSAAATAYASGVKTWNGYLGVNANGAPLVSILEKVEAAGMSTGLVATTLIQHATPGAFYGSNEDRNDYDSIALDLLSSGVDVAIGGGRNYMNARADGRDLVAELRARGYFMTDSLAGLDGVTSGNAMALYDCDDMPFVVEGRDPDYLSKATRKALEILSANSTGRRGWVEGAVDYGAGKGLFLMVEGSRIDDASHENNSEAMIGEMRDFDAAVRVAFDFADTHPGTLVVVVADHETGGLTLPAGNDNFLLPDSGVEFSWSTHGHTATMVPVWAYGAGAERFGGVMDNTEINSRMEELLGVDE